MTRVILLSCQTRSDMWWTEVQGSMPQNNVCTFQPQQMSTQFKQRWGWIPRDTQMSSLHLQQHQPKMCPVPLSGVTSTHTILHFTNLECRAHWPSKRRLLNQECFQILLLTTFQDTGFDRNRQTSISGSEWATYRVKPVSGNGWDKWLGQWDRPTSLQRRLGFWLSKSIITTYLQRWPSGTGLPHICTRAKNSFILKFKCVERSKSPSGEAVMGWSAQPAGFRMGRMVCRSYLILYPEHTLG